MCMHSKYVRIIIWHILQSKWIKGTILYLDIIIDIGVR